MHASFSQVLAWDKWLAHNHVKRATRVMQRCLKKFSNMPLWRAMQTWVVSHELSHTSQSHSEVADSDRLEKTQQHRQPHNELISAGHQRRQQHQQRQQRRPPRTQPPPLPRPPPPPPPPQLATMHEPSASCKSAAVVPIDPGQTSAPSVAAVAVPTPPVPVPTECCRSRVRLAVMKRKTQLFQAHFRFSETPKTP